MTLLTFPSQTDLPGLAWSVMKAPRFATRTQKAVSGRQLRIVDQIYPIWTFTLKFDFLRDGYDFRTAGNPSYRGINRAEMRTLAGFLLQMQGASGPFLFDDPTDDSVVGQVIAASPTYAASAAIHTIPFTPVFTNGSAVIGYPSNTLTAGRIVTFSNTGGALPTPLLSTGLYFVLVTGLSGSQFEVGLTAGGSPITMTSAGSGTQAAVRYYGGTGYANGDIVYPVGGTYTSQAAFVVGVVDGTVTSLTLQSGGAYSVVPGTTGLATTTSGSGTALQIDVSWETNAQLVRTFGGFVEPITAPNVVSNIYFNGTPQSGWSVDPDTGIVTLTTPPGSQTVTADFSYYFRCHFTDDTSEFENFMSQIWSAKEIKFESILL